MDQIHLVQKRIKSRALVNIIIDVQVVYTTANLLP